MAYKDQPANFVNCMQCQIAGNTSTLPISHYLLLPFNPGFRSRTKPTIKVVALTGTPMSVGVDLFPFRQFADGESQNLHAAQPELLLQLLQYLQIAFPKADRGRLDAGFQIVGQPTVSQTIRYSGNAIGLPKDNQRIPFVEISGNSRYGNDLDPYDARTLLLQLLFVLVAADRQTFSILDYLASAEMREEDVWLRDDIRIAWITVLNASQGSPIPHIEASYAVLGLHPDKVYPAIIARREALLGRPSPASPKKAPQPAKEIAYAAKA